MKKLRGLFVGLSTIDLEYEIARFPTPNTKLKADRFSMQPGGPAYNAAVTFSFLGGDATVVSAVGGGGLATLIHDDARANDLALLDAAPQARQVPVSSIFVEASNGNRTILYDLPAVDELDPVLVEGCYDVVLVDGFYPELAIPILGGLAGRATVVLDGGSWRGRMEKILPFVDVAICSESFRTPGTDSPESALSALRDDGISHGAVTRGERSILWYDKSEFGELEVSPIEAVDTMGAGDIFHGAFCIHTAAEEPFKDSLAKASAVTAIACKSFGTRTWMAGPDARRLRLQGMR